MIRSLFSAARTCLDAASPEEKVYATFEAVAEFARGELAIPDDTPPPEPIRMPGRPARPELVHPRALLLRDYAGGVLYKPFNAQARLQAGFDPEELESLLAAAE